MNLSAWSLFLSRAAFGTLLVFLMGAVQEVTLSGVITSNRLLDEGGILKSDDPEMSASQLSPGDIADDQTAAKGYSLVRGKSVIRIDASSTRTVQQYLQRQDATLAVRMVGTQTPSGFVVKEIRSATSR